MVDQREPQRARRDGSGVVDLPSAPWRLVVCDMDGTLVRNTTALAHLSDWIGHGNAIDDVEAKLSRGVIDDRDVAESYARFYRGVAVADACQAMSGIPTINDIGAGVQALRERNVDSLIATVSWSFTAQALAKVWGFSTGCGAELETDPASGLFTGRVAHHFAPEDKAAFVAEYCAHAGYTMEQVVAIGDSRSDVPLFESVGFSVALNATNDARATANTAVDGNSFLTALKAVPGLLS